MLPEPQANICFGLVNQFLSGHGHHMAVRFFGCYFNLLIAMAFDEPGDDSARFIACSARMIHDGSSRNRCAASRDRRAEPCPYLSRFSRQSRPSRLSQASAITAEALMNHAG